MTRLTSTIRWDVQLQFRNGFYYASAFVAIMTVLILGQFPTLNYALIMPILIFGNLLVNTFYFVAGLVLLEKGEGTLEGLIVSPLRRWEYLTAKVVTLTLLSTIETLFVVLILYGFDVNMPLLLLGIIIICALYTLFGFTFVARYDTINSFLFPSIIYTLLLSLPLVGQLALWQTPLIYLHPFQAPLVLLRGAFQPIAAWEIAYGVGYGLLWIGLMAYWSLRAFYRFVILKQGVR